MLGFLFGFNARLGRMHYCLGIIGLAVVSTAVSFAIAGYLFQSSRSGMLPFAGLMTGPMIAAGVVFAWVTFTLQSMRIRDIGWDPVCVIPTWIAILIVDKLVAVKVPAWSLGQEYHGTVVGGLLNLALMLTLLCWPSGEHESLPFPELRGRPDRPAQGADAASVTAERIARATGTEFGRRGF